MTRMLLVVAIIAPLVAGCNEMFSGPRYQIARIDDSTVVRLDTRTGEMKRFVVVIGGDVASPSKISIVHDAQAVADCVHLGHTSREVSREFAAVKGGDTVFFGKSKGGTDEAWAYRCSK